MNRDLVKLTHSAGALHDELLNIIAPEPRDPNAVPKTYPTRRIITPERRRTLAVRRFEKDVVRIRKSKRKNIFDRSYKTPVFKCHDDFEKCKKSGDYGICLALFIICVGKHVIPFVHHEK
jgi:hypothetical protein